MGNNRNPLVTIGIPTYNRAGSFLSNAIANAVGQTYDNIEILVSDNCSTDHTQEVVKQFSDPRLLYFRQSHNIGANNNFNYCLNQARGDFFLLMLDDDLIDPDFVETCINAAHSNPDIGIIRTGTRILDKAGNVLLERANKAAGLTLTEMVLAWFSNELTFYVCSTLFNTRHLRTIGGLGSKHNLFQDVMAEIKLAALYGRIDIYEAKAGFCVHDENMGASAKVRGWCEDSLELLDIICKLVPEDADLLRREGSKFFCKMNYLYASKLSHPGERLKTYLMVSKMFNHASSPFGFMYKQEIKPVLRKLKNSLIR
jgi:glycosyltransferase involved in cell wall biosynthesis